MAMAEILAVCSYTEHDHCVTDLSISLNADEKSSGCVLLTALLLSTKATTIIPQQLKLWRTSVNSQASKECTNSNNNNKDNNNNNNKDNNNKNNQQQQQQQQQQLQLMKEYIIVFYEILLFENILNVLIDDGGLLIVDDMRFFQTAV